MAGKTMLEAQVSNNTRDSVVISVRTDSDAVPGAEKHRRWWWWWWWHCVDFLCTREGRWVIHGVKVGLALVLVSLLYMLEVVHDRLGDNAMWAVMTVVVVFEFTVGATISKGLNRGVGTILGGGLGYLVALLAQDIGGVGKAVAIGTSVFIFGAMATYSRMVPRIKKRYDYGALIFILTFSLVAVSGVRSDEIVKIASDRLSSISIGFAICILVSLFIFPMWAGDQLHQSLASKFETLSRSIDECMEDFVKSLDEKTVSQAALSPCSCSSVLTSKSTDEALANFAKWEPAHGRFGFYYPWSRYLQIGEMLRELSATILSLHGFLQSKRQPSPLCLTMEVKERFEATCTLLRSTLRELGEDVYNMNLCRRREFVLEECQAIRSELCSSPVLISKPVTPLNQNTTMGGGAFVASIMLVSLLVEVLDKVDHIAKEVEELGKIAGFDQ